ncbi:MAG TPA: SDR family NAD(P)-dependent oxidoreductase [Rhodospirillales bacterium]|jgi:NAD(P)-dependent dehydrogenase (short-subunit alcohol dehydrogenase family)|nr:SDR family NAD(P)-dependent oxidoreductase [Rhodospirillales bacterium]
MKEPGSVLVMGVGSGLGASLCRRFAEAGHKVAMAARDAGKLAPIAEGIEASGGTARVYVVDGTDESAVVQLMEQVEADLGPLEVAIYNASQRVVKSILNMESAEFEGAWRVSCLGAMIVGREAARCMVARGRGSILFTGATASLRGGNGFAAFAASKFGLRALAQSMARELGPLGIHVAHFVIDGGIDNERTRQRAPERAAADGLLSPDAIAEAYYRTHAQHRSAWSHEVDLRPWREKF